MKEEIYIGKGEHSVRQLEMFCEQKNEELHQLRLVNAKLLEVAQEVNKTKFASDGSHFDALEKLYKICID